eukprot:TRINITY_DN16187_c1_g1_i1.p1 TRINITY_DN16187_c1_g1~~TRINITY_DN16187_c1_g1_i1.p1  ORF type:complete len:165 (+),score=29.67 TRINITY_DN16187_c1_g1_i1:53-547(+)
MDSYKGYGSYPDVETQRALKKMQGRILELDKAQRQLADLVVTRLMEFEKKVDNSIRHQKQLAELLLDNTGGEISTEEKLMGIAARKTPIPSVTPLHEAPSHHVNSHHPTLTEQQPRFCHGCGAHRIPAARFCQMCGITFLPPSPQAAVPQETPNLNPIRAGLFT